MSNFGEDRVEDTDWLICCKNSYKIREVIVYDISTTSRVGGNPHLEWAEKFPGILKCEFEKGRVFPAHFKIWFDFCFWAIQLNPWKGIFIDLSWIYAMLVCTTGKPNVICCWVKYIGKLSGESSKNIRKLLLLNLKIFQKYMRFFINSCYNSDCYFELCFR